MKNTVYSVAMYLRLSRDDGDIDGNIKAESNSIGSQREIIKTFIRECDNMKLYDIYTDDGFTGSNFERPEFKRMIEDIREEKVNCVIVKDLSRFGRDYIEVGRFIQKIFPALFVRFIAITDNYDSLTADASESSIVLPIKNFINDSYCRDISQKVKSQQQIKRKNGEFIGAFSVYGYIKDKENRNKLVVDEYAANIVKKIFNWKLQGLPVSAIADSLNELGILSPMQYKKSNGEKFNTGFSRNSVTKWSSIAVKRILTNEIYLGNMIQGRTEKVNYKVKKQIEKPREEWIKVEHTHRAIISENDFIVVQNLLKTDVRVLPDKKEVSLFSGIIFCGDCGQQMVRRVNRYRNTSNVYYICSTKNRGDGCSRHSIEEEKLKRIVFICLKKYVNIFLEYQELIQYSGGLTTNFNEIAEYKKEKQRIKEEYNKYYKLKSGLYEDLKSGIVSKEDFERFYRIYTNNCKELEKSLLKHEEMIQNILEEKGYDKKIESLNRYIQLEEINRYILASFVNRVNIFENKNIEIKFNFKNEFKINSKVDEVINI